MPDLTHADTDTRIFLLSNLELLSALFRGPDAEGWAGIISSGLPELLSRAPEKSTHLTASLKNLQDSLPNLSEIPDGLAELETEYVRLFVAGSGGVPAPLYESCHLGEAPRIMGDAALSMRSRLSECGLEVSLDSNEPPDHIALELEYLYHLLATAWTGNDPAMEHRAREFARLEMRPWVARFRKALNKAKPHPAYLAAADLTLLSLEEIGG